jgi:hypothetical protein
MKKLATLVVVLFTTCNLSFSQIITYDIFFPMTFGLDMTSGDICTAPFVIEEVKQSATGNTWGFGWTSTGAGPPASVKVVLGYTISEPAGPHPMTLNGVPVAPHSPPAVACSSVPLDTIDVDPSAYTFGGANGVSFDYAGSAIINQFENLPILGTPYFQVIVDYTPCTDPDIPTVTATPSTICPGGSSTLSWPGAALNSATDWNIYSGSCGGTLEGTTTTNSFIVSPGGTTTYFVRGEGGCVVPGSCSAGTVVTVDDITAPVPDVDPLPPLSAECTITPSDPTATDNCAGSLTGTPDVGFPITTQGLTVVTWTYDDGMGNITTQTQNVTLDDITAPLPDLAALPDVNDECSATPTAPTATDNCVGALTGTTGTAFPITTQGTTTVTWTYDDGNGNITTQTQDVIIDDVTPPTFSGCPADIAADADNTGCTALVSWSDPTLLDNCAGAIFTQSHTSPFAFPEGTTTVTYTGTDVGGNTVVCSFDVTVTNTLTLTVDSIVNVACFGDASGEIYTTVSGGVAPYIVDWNSGAYSGEDISLLTAGDYDAVVTDGIGCTTLMTVTVNEPASALDVTLDAANDPTACGATDGSINVTTSGGTPGYTWDWNSGTFSTEDISGLSAGTYDLTATDANGCTFSLSVSLSDPGSPTVVVDSIVDASCFGAMDGEIYITVAGGTPPLTFDWDNDGTGDTDDPEDITGLAAGSWSVIVSDAGGCSASVSGTVNEPAMLDTSVSVAGYVLTANATAVTYQWIDCADLLPIAGETNADYTVTANGSYAVVVSDGTCSDTSSCYTFTDLGVGNVSASWNIKTYPNPVKEQLTIHLENYNGELTLTLSDMSGKVLRSQIYNTIDGEILRVEFKEMAKGIYILRLDGNEGVYVQEIVKE